MSLPAKRLRLTPEEYLRIEREAPYKSEYYEGEMFSMAGGSARHSLIAMNIAGFLRSALKGKRCTPYNSDLRIGIPGEGLYTYPDVSVFCEPLEFVADSDDTATNPAVIVEVLSKNTEAYDRGRKFEHYRRMPSLREYVLVSQDAATIERFTREGDGRWVLTAASGLDATIPIGVLEVELPLAEVYDRVDLAPREAASVDASIPPPR